MDLAAVRRWWPLAAVIALLFLVSLAATRSAPQLDQIAANGQPTAPPPLLPPTAAAARTTVAQPPEAASGLPSWLGTAVLVVLAVGIVVSIVLLIWALVRDRSRRRVRKAGHRVARRRDQPRTAEDLIDALNAGLEELSDADRDPRRAVIACWVRLEQAAAAAGTPRHPGDTPADLVGRLLAEQLVDSAVLAALLEVYRQARYATHTVDDEMRRQARSALQRLRTDLGAGAPA